MITIDRAGLEFDITENGPADGEPVVLLHGFPQHADMWDALTPMLTAHGYRVLAMNQRGYSPNATPRGRLAYRIEELVADVIALIDARAGGGPVHLVGHDWGAAVAWALTAAHPERVASLTALSVPHPFAFLTAMFTSVQGLKSWYMYFFQLPWLPERLLLVNPVRTLIRFGLSPEQARRDAARFTGPTSLRTAINWYRAMPLVNPRAARTPVRRPTLFVWSDGDVAISRQAAQRCARHVQGPYTFVTLAGVSHWIPDQAPSELAELLVPHLRLWPAIAPR
ncbi:alpha/beta fold hydrolase [Thermomonospora umbrina]|uniref:Pimeloyl-ACP methyl ester carboxylesterase n=1 Tax=Thermomonospora umbrina TaxID=111806 RepID=A0A3D9T1T3_9ACTN|nr:alpha/beta fold hydrolase [Thermomonospora umbrina]REF00801.1 pimeloyl-ACP methyl ester carboxylesterase [Thermomonospora umbrina]